MHRVHDCSTMKPNQENMDIMLLANFGNARILTAAIVEVYSLCLFYTHLWHSQTHFIEFFSDFALGCFLL